MKVVITNNAEENLRDIYRYHADYSTDYADKFHDEFVRFLIDTLSAHPHFGRLYNPAAKLRRLVYRKRHNVYYAIREETVYILYILDGRQLLNILLEEPDAELPF